MIPRFLYVQAAHALRVLPKKNFSCHGRRYPILERVLPMSGIVGHTSQYAMWYSSVHQFFWYGNSLDCSAKKQPERSDEDQPIITGTTHEPVSN